MRWKLICAVLAISLQFIHQDVLASTILSRKRRGATDFYRVIQCLQPDALVLKLYGDYGCFCGVGGGGKPLDETDRCCQAHDYCYTAAQKNSTDGGWRLILFGPIGVPYHSKCSQGKVECVSKENSNLGQGFCECDKQAAKCFAEARSTYDDRLLNVNPGLWCSDSTNASLLLSQLSPIPTSATTHAATTPHPSREYFTEPTLPTTHAATTLHPSREDFMVTTEIHSTVTVHEENDVVTKEETTLAEDDASGSRGSANPTRLPAGITPNSIPPDRAATPISLYRTTAILMVSMIISLLFFCFRYASCKFREMNKNDKKMSTFTMSYL